MKRARYYWLTAMALACIAGYAPAHGDMEKIQDALSAPNGGRLRLSGQYYLELVAQLGISAQCDRPFRMIVTDDFGVT